jgi:uncharacterized protein
VTAPVPLLPTRWTSPAGVVETHCAVVVFAGDRVFKLKKGLDLGFVDLRDPEVRRRTCRRELELNRRLAPDVYLGVVDLVDDDGRPADSVLVMRRLPAERSLAHLVAGGTDAADVGDRVRAVARTVAAFHASVAATASDPAVQLTGSPAFVAGLWSAGLAQQQRFAGTTVDAEVLARTAELSSRYLAGRAPLLESRRRDGQVRDGHGDLLAADVFCLDDGPRVLDCIEFDDRLRYGDVLLDAAFLAMDLERLGRPDLGRQFLADWGEFSGESHPCSLAEHYVAYRAHVRSKVACLRAEQGDPGAVDEARSLAGLCLRHLEAARVRLVLVGGLPGTGKSTVAAGVADADGWLVLRSDVLRKQLAGVPPDRPAASPYGEGIYRPEITEQVYTELLRRAEVALAMGESVVLDASWGVVEHRARAAALADRTASDLVEVRCTAPAEVAASRMAARLAHGGDASDADRTVARRMAERAAAWPTATPLDTDACVEEVVRAARRLVGPQPGRAS